MNAHALIASPLTSLGRKLLQGSQTHFALLDQALVSGLGFLTGIATARLVGIAEFGQFALLMIFAALGQGIFNAVIVLPLMSVAGTPRGRSAAYFGSALVATAAISIGAALCVTGLIAALELGEQKPIWISLAVSAGALTFAQNLLFSVRRILFAMGRGAEGLLTDAARAVLLVVAFSFVWIEHRPIHIDLVIWLLSAATIVPALVAIRPLWLRSRGRIATVAFVRRCWPMGKWMLPTTLITFCQDQMVWLIVGVWLGDTDVGGLRAAQYLVSIVYTFLASFENVVPAEATQTYLAGGGERLRAYILRVTLSLSPVALGLPLVVALSASFWLRMLFGQRFESFSPCLQIFALVAAISFLRDMVGFYFRATHQTKVIFQSFVVSAAVTLVAIMPLIHAFGVTGAAAGIALGQGLSLINFAVAALKGPARNRR